MVKYLQLNKFYKDLLPRKGKYDIIVDAEDMGEEGGILLINVDISAQNKEEIKVIEGKIAELEKQITALQDSVLQVDITLPVILQGEDFNKKEIKEG